VIATIVCDLGFGDAGKGSITDWLVRTTNAKLVVRYNGGAQAGHTVVTGDRTHTFAQFGSGTFVPEVRTHLSRFVVVHPTGLLVEAARLASIGVGDALARLSIAPAAKIITPFHQAAGRIRELARGGARHGSCGIGAGETVRDALSNEPLTARDLSGDPRGKLRQIQERLRADVASQIRALCTDPRAAPEISLFEGPIDEWIEATRPFRTIRIADDEPPREAVVFEGAHGVLLDEWRGFHPHTTWHTNTFEHALDLLRGFDGKITRLGVMRSYATRHGPGPLPTETNLRFDEPHNPTGPWQGAFRTGFCDAVLARYALEACGADEIALTHVDRITDPWKLATKYDFPVALGPLHDLAYTEDLGRRIARARPEYASFRSAEDFIKGLENRLEKRISITSRGLRAADKSRR